jgi:5-methyltetrahydrofolate--homocysteine methyltransferase
MENITHEIYHCIVDGDHKGSAELVQQALDQGLDPSMILNEALIAAMGEVGKLFEEGEYFVPEMLVSARAMQNGLNVLKPALVKADVKPVGKVAVGTVQGDIHDIGKNLVCMMLEGAAFEIVDLGKDVSPQTFVDAVRDQGVQIVALSALLTTTMSNMQTTIELLKSTGLRDKVKVMVGGAPVTQQYADHIGADGYAQDASKAVTLAKTLLG